jgi:hypothetical protein
MAWKLGKDRCGLRATRLERNRVRDTAGDAINAILAAAALNFPKLLGASWRIFLRRMMRIWESIPVLQRSGALQTPSAILGQAAQGW